MGILTLIQGHTAANNYDGYGPHFHYELVNITPGDYLKNVRGAGLVYPRKDMAWRVMSPYLFNWITENVIKTPEGYDYREAVEDKYKDFYAFTGLHDGVDGEVTNLIPSEPIAEVKGTYVNTNGYNPTAVIYAVDSIDLLQDNEIWLMHPITGKIIRGIARNGVSVIPESSYKEIAGGNGRTFTWDSARRLAGWK